MQATDLFLGLLNGKSAGTSESFPKKADALSKDGNAFSAEFAKALDRADKSKLLAKLSQMRNAARQQDAKDAKTSAADAKQASKIDAQAANGAQKAPAVADDGKADRQAKQATKADATEKPADNSQSENVAAGSNVQESASSPNVKPEDQNNDNATGKVADINETLQALADKLEKELQGNEVEKDDKVLAEFIAYLLAFFVAQAKQQDGIAPVNGDSQNVSLELNLDPNSKLSKLLNVILGDGEATDGEALEDVNVLLKLSDDKGLLIPLTDLVAKANADAKSADATALTNADSVNPDTLSSQKFDLTFSAEALKNATLVDLTEGQKDSDISLTVSVDKIVQSSGQASVEALVQQLKQGAVDERMSKILEAIGLSKEELAQALTQNNSPKDRFTVSIPVQDLKPAKDSGLALAVSTVSSEFMSSDSYLKSLELKSLMKDAVAETKERFDIFRKIGKLLDDQVMKPELLAKLMQTKVAGIMDTSFFKDIESGQSSETKADWTSMLAKDSQTATAQQGNHVASDGSDRVVFMGRPDKGGLSFGQVLQKLDTPAYRAASGQDVSETVMKQLIQRASLSFANGNQGEVRVFLRPESLGDISLKVRMDQDTVIAKITAGSHEVKAIIEANLSQLKDALQEKGVNVGKFEVNVDTGSQHNAQNGAQDRTGDMYSSGYSGAGDVDDAAASVIPELMDGDFSYSRIGASGASSSQLSYLA